jgi:N-acetylglucosamine kinase-like BadF-type ATPase
VLGYARGPFSHPHYLGVEGSADVIDALAAEVGAPADLAVLLLAGLDFPDEEDAYRAEAERRGWASEVVVGNDTYAVLRAGTERGWGIAVTCGAGLNCVGVGPDGREVRFPSLGAASGDVMDGAGAVGTAALGAAVRSEDRRGPRTTLQEVVPEHFGFATALELSRAVHSGSVSTRRLRELTPVVFTLSDSDDVAGSLVDGVGAEVVANVRAALARLDLGRQEVEVVLGGGLLQSGNERLLSGIEEGLVGSGAKLVVRVASSRPIVGVALTALDRLSAAPDAHRRARDQLDVATGSLGDVTGDAAAVREHS